LDLRGRTIIPGLVGMHDHLFYTSDGGSRQVSVPLSFAHLYLAAGVTSIRTAGTIDLNQDIAIKREIDAGREVGPKIHLSSPYLTAAPSIEALLRVIDTVADAGVTSLKAATDLRRDELSAAIGAAHRRGLKVTGHLCAVGFRQAASVGIDNLEHGLIVDTEFYSRKVADQCPNWEAAVAELATMDIKSEPIQGTIRALVERGVAITSTLAIFETFTGRATFTDRQIEPLLNWRGRLGYRKMAQMRRATLARQLSVWDQMLQTEMAFERSFVAAGGLLMAGADPTGWGGLLAGFGDQRNVELLVEAGFSPEQAIQIASANGAKFLGESERIGTIERGKQADLVVLRGDLASDVNAIRHVEVVFKDGVGLNPGPLIEAEQGRVGPSSVKEFIIVGLAVGTFLVLIGRRYVRRRRQHS